MKAFPGVMTKLKREYESRRQIALEKAEEKTKSLHAMLPEIKKIDERLSMTGMMIMDEITKGKENLERRLKVIEEENYRLIKRRAEILANYGLPENYTDPVFTCNDCQDSGYHDGKMCHCLKKAIATESLTLSGLGSLAKTQDFESFNTSYYDIKFRERAENNLQICKDYADDFGNEDNANLLFIGGTGLGKTHLSTSIAKKVIEKGYYVVYVSSQTMISDFSSLRFGQGQEDEDSPSAKYFDADLLIIDDLGTELNTPYSVSVIYNVINTRLCRDKAMIISTNLTSTELKSVYAERITSRLFGNFYALLFEGRDNRMVIKQSKLD
ncbi:MAG: hypothetical protein E7675_00995 [Ruminococcaceae bacterium]|nr:hypothetical protein [Oscillospiraceae bacterium]